jgi:aminotransferase
MGQRIARNVAGMRISAIKEMAMLAAGMEDVASLTWGLPSFRTPAHIRAAVAKALAEDPALGMYSLPDGLPELRRLAAQAHERATGVAVDPDANILITAGNMQGISMLLHVLLDPGDEVVITDPGFASHLQQIRLCGGTAVHWALDESNGWSLDVEALTSLIGERTKAIVLVSPSNPTGRIFRREELMRVGEIARERDLVVLIDDPYSHFAYENTKLCFNLASRPEFADHVAYLFTFSKCHAMSGWRLGYAVLPAALKSEALKVHDAMVICAPRVSQRAGIAALSNPPDHLAEFESALARRRNLICARLDAVDHVFDYVRPEGTYYVFPRILVPHRDSTEFALRLLHEARVTVTPGVAFGPRGEGHVRMAFCVEEEVIERAFDRIEALFPR